MGEGKDKHSVGEASGVGAEDIVNAPNAAGLGVGKFNLVQSHEVGSQYVDHDARCTGKDDNTAGCFLGDGQRHRLIEEFVDRAGVAQTNYKLALEELRVAALIEKDKDPNWALSMLLDLLGAHFVAVFARGLSSLKAAQVANMESKMLEGAASGAFDPQSMSADVAGALSNVKEKSVEAYVKTAVDQSKKQLLKPLKTTTNASRDADRDGKVAYIDWLKDLCDIGFQNFKDEYRGSRNDAEMVVIWRGMDAEFHKVGAYKEALSGKLQRFRESGVNDIGRTETTDRLTHDADVYRDTRVIWLVDQQGNKTLWFQSQDGDVDSGVIHDDDPIAPSDFRRPDPWTFGPRDPREGVVLGKPVPDEFKDVALLRSEAKWGRTPSIFDPALDLAARWTRRSVPAPNRDPGAPIPRLELRNIVKHVVDDAMVRSKKP